MTIYLSPSSLPQVVRSYIEDRLQDIIGIATTEAVSEIAIGVERKWGIDYKSIVHYIDHVQGLQDRGTTIGYDK